MNEEWRAVPEFEGMYEVSNIGNFRSLDRWVDFSDGRRRFFEGRPCKLKINIDGYPLVLLSAGMARKKWHLAHVIVARVFVGLCPDGQETRHLDGVPAHIAVANLAYGTRARNSADKMIHRTMPFGETHHSAHVPAVVIEAIKADQGTVTEIAERHGVSRTHAWNIRAGLRRDSLSEMLAR